MNTTSSESNLYPTKLAATTMELFQLSFTGLTTTTILSFLFLFLLFVFNLVLVLRRSFSSKTPQLPPGPWKLPFIGSIHHLLTADSQIPHRALRSLSKRYGPLMHLQLGEVSLVVVSSPSMAEKLLKTHDLAFAQRPQQLVATKILTYDNQSMSFSPYGAYWRQMRKVCMTEFLSAKRVRSSAFIREEEVAKLVRSIKLPSGEGMAVNVTEKLYSLFNDVTARAAFGKGCRDKDVFVKSFLEATATVATPHLCDMFPSLKILYLVRRRWIHKIENLHRRLDMIFDKIVKEHEQKQILEAGTEERGNCGDESAIEEDLVDSLLGHQRSGCLEFPITTDNIKAVTQDMFTGGTETSSSTIAWALSELMREPEAMEKAQTEVREAALTMGKKPILQSEDIQRLKYLKVVVKETLRLHPPLPLLVPRESREECCIDGYKIPLKTIAVVNVWAIGRDPEYWEDPESFRPERFQGSSGTVDYTGTQFHYLPFGSGRRMCPGVSFGIAGTEFALAQLLYHFNWKLPDGMRPDELDMTEAFGATVGRKKDLYLVATPYDHDGSEYPRSLIL